MPKTKTKQKQVRKMVGFSVKTHENLKIAATKQHKNIEVLAEELMEKILKMEGLWYND